MSEIVPPVQIGDPANESRVKYMNEVAASPDFDYPDVSFSFIA